MAEIINVNGIECKQYIRNNKYYVSKCGKVYSSISNKFLKNTENLDGHYRVDVYINGKQKHIFVHQMVYETWNGLYDKSKYVIRHLNDNPADNRLENLRLGTQKDNIQDSIKNKHFGKTLVLEDRMIDKTYTFCPGIDFFNTFTEYKLPKNKNMNFVFKQEWFQRRFKILSFGYQ